VAGDKSLGSDKGPKPGEGPSREERENGFYDVLFLGTDAAGHSLRVGVKGDRDPGYGSTSKMIAEAAVCLLQDAASTPGGIWTPACAWATALIARLQANAGLIQAPEELGRDDVVQARPAQRFSAGAHELSLWPPA
jgi:short subunit dehydrogenase-like uncharacterized protein